MPLRRPRIQITGVTILILLAIGGLGYGLYDRYVPRSEAFIDAVAMGNAKDVRRWLRRDPTLAAQWMDAGHSLQWPLELAAWNDHPGVVRVLLDYGAPLAVPGNGSYTTLHSSLRRPSPEIVSLLIAAGSDPAGVDHDTRTPLHCLAASDEFRFIIMEQPSTFSPPADPERLVAIARVLIDAGCPLESRDFSGMTALHIALACHSLDLADYLIDRGADLSARTPRPFEPAGSTWLDRADIREPRVIDPTPLHTTIANDEPIEVLRWLIDHGASLDATADYYALGSTEPQKVTPLELAQLLNRTTAIEFLQHSATRLPD